MELEERFQRCNPISGLASGGDGLAFACCPCNSHEITRFLYLLQAVNWHLMPRRGGLDVIGDKSSVSTLLRLHKESIAFEHTN